MSTVRQNTCFGGLIRWTEHIWISIHSESPAADMILSTQLTPVQSYPSHRHLQHPSCLRRSKRDDSTKRPQRLRHLMMTLYRKEKKKKERILYWYAFPTLQISTFVTNATPSTSPPQSTHTNHPRSPKLPKQDQIFTPKIRDETKSQQPHNITETSSISLPFSLPTRPSFSSLDLFSSKSPTGSLFSLLLVFSFFFPPLQFFFFLLAGVQKGVLSYLFLLSASSILSRQDRTRNKDRCRMGREILFFFFSCQKKYLDLVCSS